MIVKTVINTYLLLLLGHTKGWSGDANVLGKIFSAGRPTNFDYSRARVYIACSRCDWLILGLTALSDSISIYIGPFPREREKGWLVGCFGLNGPLRQYFSLYQAVSQREGERGEKEQREKKCPNNPHPHLLQAQ